MSRNAKGPAKVRTKSGAMRAKSQPKRRAKTPRSSANIKSSRTTRSATTKKAGGHSPKTRRPGATLRAKSGKRQTDTGRKDARSAHAARRAVTSKPIGVYYWPTPNGWKITIMLEECRLPYEIIPVNIGTGEQFTPEFLKLSPNNRMPAIVDPDGPGGRPISIFESGAILRYLGVKTGRFYPADERGRTRVDQWLFWQMANLGPMCGQANHFRYYKPEGNEYARERYTNEVNRLYGVMESVLRRTPFLAGRYSIADMAAWPWVVPWKMQGQNLDDFPHLKAWFERVGARSAVKRGRAVGEELRKQASALTTEESRKVLFGQRARVF